MVTELYGNHHYQGELYVERSNNTDENSLPILPLELFQLINPNLSKADSRNLAAANTSLYLGLNPLQIREWKFAQPEDVTKFHLADELIQFGKYLPELSQPENRFTSKQAFFEHLSGNCSDLFVYLRKNPELINTQDESGSTILHHAALLLRPYGKKANNHLDANSILLTLDLLFSTPGIDVTIKDTKGNTPVHLACFPTRQELKHISPFFVKKAISSGFDCSTKGEGGLTILHMAATHLRSGRRINEKGCLLREMVTILTQKYDPSDLQAVLNATTDDGDTALNKAVKQRLLVEAKMLIDAGAKPKLSHSALEKLDQLKIPLEHNRYMTRWDNEVDEAENRQIAKMIRQEREALQLIYAIEGSIGGCTIF